MSQTSSLTWSPALTPCFEVLPWNSDPQAQTNVTADIRILNVNAQDLTVEGTANISKEFDAIKNKTFDWKTNYSNASTLAMLYGGTNSSTNTGGIIGWLGTGTITDPTLNNVTISAISAIGGVAGRVDKNTEIVFCISQ